MTFHQQYQISTSRGRSAFTPVIKSTKKRVAFKSTVAVHEIDAEPMTKEEKSTLFYTKDDLRMTSLEVRAVTCLSNQLPQTLSYCSVDDPNNESSKCILAMDESDSFLRGLEFYIYPQRLQNRLLVRKALIKYQSHLHKKFPNATPEEFAKAMKKASEKLSAWSQLVAQETARIDSLRAYDSEYLIPLDTTPVEFSSKPTLPPSKVLFKEVRRVTSESDDLPPRPFKRARAA